MMAKKSYQATNKYHVEYNRRKYKRIEIVLDRERDATMIAFLDRQPNRGVYIKELIRSAMLKNKK